MISALLILLSLSVLIQVYFHWFEFSKLLRYKAKVVEADVKPISIIVAARNEAENLKKLIPYLMESQGVEFELIVVNDRSIDDSKDNLDNFQGAYSNLMVLHFETAPDNWNGKKHAIYQAIQHAKYENLLFTDADCIPLSPYWASQMSSQLNMDDIVLGFSPYRKSPSLLNGIIQMETLLTAMQYLNASLNNKAYMAVGRNYAIRKSIYDLKYLEEIKSITGGDDDLMINHLSDSAQIGISINPKTQVNTVAKSTIKEYIKQKIRHLSVGKYYKRKDKTRLALFTFAHLVFWILAGTLLLIGVKSSLILVLIGLRSLSFYTIFTLTGQKLQHSIKLWKLPFLDLIYSFFYPYIGIRTLLVKEIKWS